MTREETKDAIRIMQAYVDGKKIEHNAGMGWFITDNPSWRFGYDIYRIAPDQEEPKKKHYRPYTMEEFVEDMHKHDGFVRGGDYDEYNQRVYGLKVVNVFQNEVSITNNGTFLYPDYKSLCEYYIWSDNGQPCGKEVTE